MQTISGRLIGKICLQVGFALVFFTAKGYSWSADDFSLFDLVEEIEGNFYGVLEVTRDASLGEIKRAYRRQSLKFHPDKNPEPDAAVKFRKIAAIYEVLKSEESREKYNEILDNGLPDWRQPIWYYRKVRKMPWWETGALLLVVVTVGHYLMLWGAYWEQRLTLMEGIEARFRRKEKKLRRKYNIDVQELMEDELNEHLDRPSLRQLLPFILSSSILSALVNAPSFLCEIWTAWRKQRSGEEEEEDDQPPSRRPPPVYLEPVHYDMATDVKPVSTMELLGAEEEAAAPTARQEWTLDQISLLIRLSTTKYPIGTAERWEKMAATLKRRPQEITDMIGKLKHMDPQEYQKLASGGSSKAEDEAQDEQNESLDKSQDESWSQSQQKLLEQALVQFPKGTSERWEKIARCVPGKSKDECMARFKHLAEMVRCRKKVQDNSC